VFQDPDGEHLALLQAVPHDRQILLTVRGPLPQNFFSLLRDGLEVTLARFPGLPISRKIPCPGHAGLPCKHEFTFENVLRGLNRKPRKDFLECPEGLEDISISRLLFGLHPASQDDVIREIRGLASKQRHNQKELVKLITQQQQLLQRGFTNIYRTFQGNVDLECPNAFIFRHTQKGLLQDILGPQGRSYTDRLRGAADWPLVELHLLCQEPGQWHLTSSGGRYVFGKPPAWFRDAAPLLKHLVGCLKRCFPLKGELAVEGAAAFLEAHWKEDLLLTEDLVERLTTTEFGPLPALDGIGNDVSVEVAQGAAVRALRRLFEKLDSDRKWGGLQKTVTPEGHWLWLCEEHRAIYLS